jgi:hypothetical protein
MRAFDGTPRGSNLARIELEFGPSAYVGRPFVSHLRIIDTYQRKERPYVVFEVSFDQPPGRRVLLARYTWIWAIP